MVPHTKSGEKEAYYQDMEPIFGSIEGGGTTQPHLDFHTGLGLNTPSSQNL